MSRFYSDHSPKSLNEVVLKNPSYISIFQAIVKGDATPNLLLFGPVGTGKTAIAKLMTEQYYLNRCEGNWTTFLDLTTTTDFSMLRSQISRSTAGLTDRWWFILDESDKIPANKANQLLNELHNIIGKYGHCSFILTTNSLGQMPAGIKSRCYPVAIEPPTPQQFLQRARDIIDAEGKAATDEEILEWLSMGDEDIRQYLSILELQLSLRPIQSVPKPRTIQTSTSNIASSP